MNVHVISYRDKAPTNGIVIDVTSRSKDFYGRQLSPFFLGPVHLYSNIMSVSMENAWQFSKVYPQHDDRGRPSTEWWQWAMKGWSDTWAHRYPMGKGAIPNYSWWNGQALNYIEARKQIYIPLYAAAAITTKAYAALNTYYTTSNIDLYLRDFDGYDYLSIDYTLEDVVNDPSRKMGHAFVLAMMLTSVKVYD